MLLRKVKFNPVIKIIVFQSNFKRMGTKPGTDQSFQARVILTIYFICLLFK